MGTTVLVTGATGFTGNWLARYLLKLGYEVRALVRSPAKAAPLAESGFAPIIGDVRNPADVDRAVHGCSTVYHIAALFRSAKFPVDAYFQVNAQGTQHVLDAARRYGVSRVVHCSTVGVHGDIQSIPADETTPFRPGDVYQQSKLKGEMLAREAAAQGLPVTVFRPCGIYGPGDLRFLKLFRMASGSYIRLLGRGRVAYHLTHIRDLIEGIVLCGTHPAAIGQTYILAGPRYTSIDELVTLVAQAANSREPRLKLPLWPIKLAAVACEGLCRPLGIEPPLHRRRLDFFCKDRAFSCAKAQRELGYNPRIDLPEGLAQTAEWYRQNGYLPDNQPEARPKRPALVRLAEFVGVGGPS